MQSLVSGGLLKIINMDTNQNRESRVSEHDHE